MKSAPALSASLRDAPEIKVWDPFVRLFHWSVALGFFVAYFTEDNIGMHVWAGYVVGMLVLLRIVWGFVGPEHARFSDFLFSPFRMLSYTAGLLTLKAGKRYVGHSPAGAAMVFALLLGLLATVGSGLVLYAVDENAGPLAGFVGTPTAASGAMLDAENDDDDESGGRGNEAAAEYWEEIHEVVANIVLGLALLHIAGVLLASFVHHENLTRGMIWGRKRGPE